MSGVDQVERHTPSAEIEALRRSLQPLGPLQVINGNVYAGWSEIAPFTDLKGVHHADYRSGLVAIVYEKDLTPVLAAAPELLAALKACFTPSRAPYGPGCPGCNLEIRDPQLVEGHREGCAVGLAIAKAEGRS